MWKMGKVHFVHVELEKYRKIFARDNGKIYLSTSLVSLLPRSLLFRIWNLRKLCLESSPLVPRLCGNDCGILNLVLFVKCAATEVKKSAAGVKRCITVVGT